VFHLTGPERVTYRPDDQFCGADSFAYTVNGQTATVSVTVTCINDAADAVNDAATVAEDSGATTINVRTNDTDPDTLNAGGTKDLVTSKTNGAHGTVAITNAGADVSYTPNANYCGADAFTYTVAGGDTANVAVTITCVDDNPVAVDDSKTIAEDSGAAAIDVLANDTDVDGGAKTVGAKTNGSHGSVAMGSGGADVSYTPDADYCGEDSFTYSLNGGSTATVAVTVTCVDDPVPGPGPDTQAPETTITKAPAAKTKKTKATVEFSSSEAGSHFECKLDGGAFASCTSPATFTVKKGKHTLLVRAVDAAGNPDATPAQVDWTVKKKKRRHH
jgi:hypothetical protein